MKTTPAWIGSLLLIVLCAGCKTAQVTSERSYDAPTPVKPAIVYVADFELGLEAIKHEDGTLSELPGPTARAGSRLSGASGDRAARAKELVTLMSTSLIKELTERTFAARRLAAGAPLPSSGWLLRGVFLEVQEGNRVRRSLVGFGQGKTDVQVVTTLNDLTQGQPKPLYEVATAASSGSTPGAAPTLALGPYGAAARFVMAGQDVEKNVKQTAARIAEQVAGHVQPAR